MTQGYKTMKRKLISVIAILFFSPLLVINALAKGGKCLMLNQVAYRTQAQQWATTTTAKVTVTVDASLAGNKLGQLHAQVMKKLQKIASKVEWHITQFNRSQEQSGLERVTVIAQARIPQQQLSDLRKQAKAVSQPGQTYRISDIQFTPSMAEVERVRGQLRDQIYNDANAELARLNKVYPNAHYSLHSITFDGAQPIVPMPGPMRTMFMAKVAGPQAIAPALTVSNKVTISANVVLSAKMLSSRPEAIKTSQAKIGN